MGFAAEIKEFLGAAKDSWKLMSDTEEKAARTKYTNVKAAAEQKEMDDPLNQQLKEANLAHKLASTANIGKMTPLQQLYYQQWKAAQQPQVDPAAAATPQQPSGAAIGPTTVPYTDPASLAVQPAAGPQIGTRFKRGGLVRKFQEGGLVEDEDLEDEFVPPAIGDTDFSGQARPLPSPAVGGNRLPQYAPASRSAVAPATAAPAKVDTAQDAGLKYGITQFLPPAGVPSAGRQRAVRAYAQGAGAAPIADMLQIYKKVDPDGTKGESVRNMEALNAVYQYKMNSNDPDGAAKAAFQMLQHYKIASTRYAAIAAAAMEGGEINAGLKAAMKAYANIPDGKDLKLWVSDNGQINYSVTTADGKKEGGIASPEQIGASLMKLGSPGGFERQLVQAAGEKYAGKAAFKGATAEPEVPEAGKPPKPGDYQQIEDQVSQYVDKAVAAYRQSPEFKKSGKDVTDQEQTQIKNVMFHMRRTNDITNDEGFKSARTFITAPEPKTKDDPLPFRVNKDKESGMATIRFASGQTLRMPMDDYLPLSMMRREALAAADAAANKPKEKSYTEMGTDVVGAAGRANEAIRSAAFDPVAAAAQDKEGGALGLAGAVAAAPFRGLGAAYSAPIEIGKKAIGAVSPTSEELKSRLKVLQRPEYRTSEDEEREGIK